MAPARTFILLGLAGIAEGFRARHKSKDNKLAGDAMQKASIPGYPGELPGGIWDVLPDPEAFPHCHLSESACPIDEMTEATLVYTDSPNSVCFSGESFAFLVVPGARDKMLFFLPGGGACYELPVFDAGLVPTCFPTFQMGLAATGIGLGGILDRNNSRNAFKDYTVVSPPYCSGGAHVANASVQGLLGTYFSYGYNNNEFARTWALNNLAPTLKSFVIMGSSAGALGTSIWADFMLSAFSYEKATVIMDSYIGVFPEDTQGPTVKKWDSCNLPIMGRQRDECNAGRFNLQDFVDGVIASYPNVAFAHLQCKVDIVQRLFYKSIAASYGKLDFYITERTFYQTTNEMLQRYNRHPNYVTYVVSGWFHTFAQWNFWYTASVAGQNRDPPSGTMGLAEWVTALVNHDRVTSHCDGGRRPNGWYALIGTRFCDEAVFPKTLTIGR